MTASTSTSSLFNIQMESLSNYILSMTVGSQGQKQQNKAMAKAKLVVTYQHVSCYPYPLKHDQKPSVLVASNSFSTDSSTIHCIYVAAHKLITMTTKPGCLQEPRLLHTNNGTHNKWPEVCKHSHLT